MSSTKGYCPLFVTHVYLLKLTNYMDTNMSGIIFEKSSTKCIFHVLIVSST